MPIVSGGGGGASLAPPVTLTGTDPATIPLTVKGAAGQSTSIASIGSSDNTLGLVIDGDSANSIAAASLATKNFGFVSITTNGQTAIGADTHIVHLSGSATGGFILSAFNTALADAALSAGDLALWFDKTNGAAKLMVKAKQSDGTVVAAAIALA